MTPAANRTTCRGAWRPAPSCFIERSCAVGLATLPSACLCLLDQQQQRQLWQHGGGGSGEELLGVVEPHRLGQLARQGDSSRRRHHARLSQALLHADQLTELRRLWSLLQSPGHAPPRTWYCVSRLPAGRCRPTAHVQSARTATRRRWQPITRSIFAQHSSTVLPRHDGRSARPACRRAR